MNDMKNLFKTGTIIMDGKIKRRSFFKHFFSLLTFSAGSLFLYKGRNRVGKIGKYWPVDITPSEALAGHAGSRVKKIAVEEHIYGDKELNSSTIDQLDKRLRDMDEAGIDMQVISFALRYIKKMTPSEDVADARSINEMLSKTAKQYPERLAFYSTLPMLDPDAAVYELERAVKDLGLKGPMIFSGSDGTYIDEQKFWGIYEMAEKLDVPIYIHPGALLPDIVKPYRTYPILSGPMWGFAAATGLQAMRLIVSGVFDRYPGLMIMLGHMGEGIPYWLWRMDKHYEADRFMFEKDAPGFNLKNKPSQYFKDNFYITTSGMCWQPVLQFVLSVMGADRVLFAADYPPESALEAARFIESAQISDEDKEKICHGNAEKLLKL
jgi:predicted TIM-barrel fold metal-dependent hydrolase